MNQNLTILYPSIAMALLTLTLLMAMGLRRWIAVAGRAVSVKYYRTFSEGDEPESLRRHTRHMQNHFELPLLFHAAVIASAVAGIVSPLTVGVAWFFVVSRCVHSAIHLGYNNVTHRFCAYGAGLFAVLFLWLNLLVALA